MHRFGCDVVAWGTERDQIRQRIFTAMLPQFAVMDRDRIVQMLAAFLAYAVTVEYCLTQFRLHSLPPIIQKTGRKITLSIVVRKQRWSADATNSYVSAGDSVLFVADEFDDLTVICERDSREPVQYGTRQFVNVGSDIRQSPPRAFRLLKIESCFHFDRSR